jgi:hypothetical protein
MQYVSASFVFTCRCSSLASLFDLLERHHFLSALGLFAGCCLTKTPPSSFTPSQNILQSLQKWRDILEYLYRTINWWEWFGSLESTISSYRWPRLKWEAASCLVACRFAFALIQPRLEMLFDFQSTDATTNWNVEKVLSSKDEALFGLVLSADACTSTMAFNAAFADWQRSQQEPMEHNVLISNWLMQQPTEMWKKACLEGFD